VKEIVVISGKGGTGKTSLTASFAYLGGKDVVVADCDVDASDMHLLLQPDFSYSEDFFSGELAHINQYECIQCGKCADVCRFDAIHIVNSKYNIDHKDLNVGKWYVSTIKTGSIMVHAKLGIGADNSGKLVAKVKSEAKDIAEDERKDFVIVDGSPGLGCPVVSSLSGASYVVLVTEPSVSGLHDLKRVFQLVQKFKIKAGCIINKADINKKITVQIEEFLIKENIDHLVNLPYDENFTRAMTNGQTIVEYSDNHLKDLITDSWNRIKQTVNK